MRNKSMIDKKGRLTAYALACGYVEIANSAPGSANTEVKMDADSHGNFYTVWTTKAPYIRETFPTLQSARTAFVELAKQRSATPNWN